MDEFFQRFKAQMSAKRNEGGESRKRGGNGGTKGSGTEEFAREASRNEHSSWRKEGARYGGGAVDEDEDEGASLGSVDTLSEEVGDEESPRADDPRPAAKKRRHGASNDDGKHPPPPPPPKPKQPQCRGAAPPGGGKPPSTHHEAAQRKPAAAGDVVHIGPAHAPGLKVVGDYTPDDENALDDVGLPVSKKWGRVRPEREWAVTPSLVHRRAQLGAPQPKSECFGCVYARSDSTAIEYLRWNALEAMVEKMFSSADLEALAVEIEKYYNQYIRGPTVKAWLARGCTGGAPLPEWRAATIVAHFEVHNNDFLFRRVKRLRQVDELADQLFNHNMFVWARHMNGELMRDDEGKPILRIDNDSLSSFSMLCRLEAALYGQNPKSAILSTRSETLAKDVRPALSLEGKTFQTTDGGLFTGCTPLSFRGGAGEGGTVGAQRKM